MAAGAVARQTRPNSRWEAVDAPLRWAFWDDEFVVFHPGTGQAHLLDVYAAEALDLITASPATTDDVTVALAALAERPADEAIHHRVIETLGALETQGLVRRGAEALHGSMTMSHVAQAWSERAPAAMEEATFHDRRARATADETWRASLRERGATLEIGPVRFRLRGKDAGLAAHLERHYRDAFLSEADVVVDAEISVAAGATPGRRHVLVDGRAPSAPAPRHLVPPFVEWAMNWALATRLHRFLLIHAAVIERNGRAIVLAGAPGAGKSTLCAALVAARGWRLLSDEFLILDPRTGMARPMPRPIALKDGAIAALAKLAATACDGPIYTGTPKGALVYVKAPQESLRRQDDMARPSVIVFPRFTGTATLEGSPLSRARAFLRLADNAFNFALRGPEGFAELARMVEVCTCWDLVFGDLEPAIDFIERIAAGATDAPSLRRRHVASIAAT